MKDAQPEATRAFRARGHAEVVTLGEFTLGRAIYEPGWRWSPGRGDLRPR